MLKSAFLSSLHHLLTIVTILKTEKATNFEHVLLEAQKDKSRRIQLFDASSWVY